MKVRVRCVQVNTAKFLHPQTGELVENKFAIFEGRDGEAIKINFSEEELKKFKPKEEYEFEFNYSEVASIHLPS